MKILGIVGTVASGKGEVASLLVAHGYSYLKLSDLLREELQKKNIPISRESLTSLGNSLRQEQGSGVLAQLAIEKIKMQGDQNVLIDGIRNPAEIDELKSFGSTTIIAVDANAEIRKQRYMSRAIEHRTEDRALEEEFLRIEQIERSVESFGQNIPACIERADFIVINESNLEELKKEVDTILEAIRRNQTVEGQQKRGKERL